MLTNSIRNGGQYMVVVTVGVESEDGDDLYVVDGRELTNARCGFWLLDVH
jgi:hypothetical protein